jgi:NitT/TauT family transport system substrate-binding protein
MFKKVDLIILLVILAVLTGCASSGPSLKQTYPPSAPQNVKIRVGSLPRIFDIIVYAAQQEGIFQKHQLTVEIVSFRSQVEKDTAFLAGELDGNIEGTYAAINMNKERETSKLVGHGLMPHMFELIVSPSSGITSPVQLKGKEVATSTGTTMEYALDAMLAGAGISGKDVKYVNVPNMPLRLEMLAQGKLPAAIFTSPLSDQAVADGNILLLDDTRQLLGGPGLIFSTDALKNKSDGVSRFVQSWQEAVRMINADPEKYRSLLVSTAKVSDSLARSIKIPVFPELKFPSKDEVAMIVNWMKSREMITQDVPYEKIIEMKYLK